MSETQSTVLTVGEFQLNLIKREVFRGGRRIELQTKEFFLLEYFLRNPGRVITKEEILEKIWNYNFDPDTNVVNVLICRLRFKLEKETEEKVIKTIRGVGFMFGVK